MTQPHDTPPDHERWMREALAEAALAAQDGEAPVGAVIVDPAAGRIIARGRNRSISAHDPTAHAEIVALRAAATALGNYRLKPGLDLYVTLEPCAMCAGAISHARIARVIYGAPDPKGGGVAHGARVFDHPTCHWRPVVCSGVLAAAASEQLRSFFRSRRGKA
jgi:tRNA(Arg) A34 adenosine deaminase TadA